MPLTAHQREALTEARRHGELRRTHDDGPGQPPWPAPAVTLHSLVRRELLKPDERRNKRGVRMSIWTITDAGLEALEPPARRQPRDTPRFLAHPSSNTGDYTTNPARAIDDLEAVDAARLDRTLADRRHARDRGPTRQPGNRQAA